MPLPFEIFLFSTRPEIITAADHAGISGFFVDWENRDKLTRQQGFDTQINFDTLEDLLAVRNHTQKTILCRINRFDSSPASLREIEEAIDGGCDEILLPMVEFPSEIEQVLRVIRERVRVGLILETITGCDHASTIGALPLSRVYVGLNDLHIQRKDPTLFAPLIDGTIENIRPHFSCPFGLLGLTRPDLGSPIPTKLFIAQLARLECTFTFLRRSFLRDCKPETYAADIASIFRAVADAKHESMEQLRAQHTIFCNLASSLAEVPIAVSSAGTSIP